MPSPGVKGADRTFSETKRLGALRRLHWLYDLRSANCISVSSHEATMAPFRHTGLTCPLFGRLVAGDR